MNQIFGWIIKQLFENKDEVQSMDRKVNLDDITDGRVYGINDMVKADCGGCKGCSACCRGMGNSIVLDPLDINHLVKNTGYTFEQLLVDKIELNVVEGIILPNLRMSGQEDACSFLNQEGRCTIHSYRPGICRIFPLGRYYEGDSFQYIFQIHECKKENKSKIKVKKWIDIDEIKKNERFILDWHAFVKQMQLRVKHQTNELLIKQLNVFLLNQFYIKPYESEEFYTEFTDRLQLTKNTIQDNQTQ